MRVGLLSWFCVHLVGCTRPEADAVAPESPSTVDTGDTASLETADTGHETTHPYVMSGFSFIDAHVAGLPQPGRVVPLATDLAFLVEQDIALLVSLTETPTDPAAVAAAGMDLLHLPIRDFTPPSLEQQVEMVDAILLRVDADERVGIHDTAGLGRCGTMLATWFVRKGRTADEAIVEIRSLRPGSIETEAQEAAVHAYAAALEAEGR